MASVKRWRLSPDMGADSGIQTTYCGNSVASRVGPPASSSRTRTRRSSARTSRASQRTQRRQNAHRVQTAAARKSPAKVIAGRRLTLGVDATGAPMRRDASPARRCGYASYCRRFEKEKDGGAATIRPEEHAMRSGGADLHAVGGGQAADGWTLALGCIRVDGRGPAAARAPQGRTPSDR